MGWSLATYTGDLHILADAIQTQVDCIYEKRVKVCQSSQLDEATGPTWYSSTYQGDLSQMLAVICCRMGFKTKGK